MSHKQDFPFDIEYVVHLLNLRIRRPREDGVYTDCPFCGDNRGKLKVNYHQNVWRCNYCNEGGGMLKLYAMAKNISTSEALREINDTIMNGDCWNHRSPAEPMMKKTPKPAQRSTLADISVIHDTLSGLLGMLKLSEQHREHLRVARGLTDEEIDRLGYKSTPPFYMCKPLTERLIAQGYTVEGVPGFYQKDGAWTVSFSTILAGILIPVKGVDGLIRGCQIRLDVPLKDENEDEDKPGAKYVWLSSAGKPMGTSSGSPVHIAGEPNSRVVYVTEGILKADISHILMNRTFAGIAGISNLAQLELLLAYLAENGTEVIIGAPDLDRFRNENVSRAVTKMSILARNYGMDFRLLFWNPNYKGVDDWQLAVKRKSTAKEDRIMNFRKRFIYGLCSFDAIDDEVATWHESKEYECKLHEFLGLTDDEFTLGIQTGYTELEKLLLSLRKEQKYRIYQVDLNAGKVIPYALGGIKFLHKAGYEYPPAADYRLVHEGTMFYEDCEDEHQRLTRLTEIFGDELPEDYHGRSVAPSDVLEIYTDTERKYFYRDENGFWPVKFSPMLAKPITK